MRQEDIPPEIRVFLDIQPQIERQERRYRVFDWVMPVIFVALVFIQGDNLIGRLASCLLGVGVGVTIATCRYRRQSFRTMKESVEHLQLDIAMALEHEEEE